jgi:purine-nucleoside phosphorylase
MTAPAPAPASGPDAAVAASAERLEAMWAGLRDAADPACRTGTATEGSIARPGLAIVLGSGWGPVAERVQAPRDLAYAELPAFPVLDVAGHAGSLRLGTLGGVPVWVLRGRQHAYEQGDAAAMKGAIRSLAAVGVRGLVLTNAAGSLVPGWPIGSLMLLRDHLNLPQRTPLLGERGSARFVDLRDAYDPVWAERAHAVARERGMPLHDGVYAWTLGPQFETPAEVRMIGLLGAQAVGMSTVPEVILARHAGLQVLALSMLTNLAAGLDHEALSHAQTLSAAQAAAPEAAAFVEALMAPLAASLGD